jgi:GNAT superfamily N-acetyltransferase
MLEIRPIAGADIDDVARVHVRSWQAGYAGILPAGFLAALDPADFAARRRAQPRPAGSATLVADDDGQIVGLASFGPERPEHGDRDPAMAELYAIYVAADHWRGGIGRRLFASAKTALTEAGFRAMRLWVLEQNHRARRFYEGAGMRWTGERQLWRPRDTTIDVPELRYETAL